jgi:multiple sugar transport system ATP-binding protein
MARVQLQNVSKSFGSHSIIDNLNLDIADGEFTVLVGASGCGKSTTLRLIAGLEASTSGSILIDGRDVTWVEPNHRNCAMVFQNYALFPQMTVAENIGYGLKLRGIPRVEIDEAVRKAADTLGLTQLLSRLPKALSGGQRQRVAIGRAIVRKPDVFLFDEPLSNLDAKLRVEMRAEIKELHQRLETTIVYVTHDQVEAMTLADRVVVMDKGRISQAADPMTLYSAPANTFVAGFIGAPSMNFLNCKLTKNSKASVSLLLEDGNTVPIDSASLPHGAILDVPLIVGFRPEALSRDDHGFGLEVRTVEQFGSHQMAIGYVAGKTVTAQLPSNDKLKLGDKVHLEFKENALHFFNSANGVRLSPGISQQSQ